MKGASGRASEEGGKDEGRGVEATERVARPRRCPLLLAVFAPGAHRETAWGRKLGLPPRLVRVAACLALGDSDRQSAQRLAVSLRTLRSYAQDLYRRLEVVSRVQAADRVLTALGCRLGSPRQAGHAHCCDWGFEVSLPPRLLRVATCAAEGLSDKEVSERLGLSPHTVRNYLKEVYARLQVRGRADLVCALATQR